MDKALKTLLALVASILAVPCCHAQIMQQVVMATPHSGGGIPAVVQSVGAEQTFPTFLNFDSSITSGNIIVAVMYSGAFGATLTATDTAGNTFTTLASSGLPGDDDAIAIACAPITVGGSDQVQFLVNGTGSTGAYAIYEVSNATCTQDVTAVHATSTATACSSGPMTTSTANDFLVAICGLSGSSSATVSAGSGWSGGLNATNSGGVNIASMTEYSVATSPGSFTATSGTIASQEQATLLVALKSK